MNSTSAPSKPASGRFKPYPFYKNSGIEWLDKVPDHWDYKRLRFVTAMNPTKSEVRGLDADIPISFIPMEAIGEYGGLRLDSFMPLFSALEGYTYFREGDIVIAKITPCFENGKGAIGDGLENGIAFGTTELHVLRPGPEMEGHFLFYVTMSDHFRRIGASRMYGAGGQKRVPNDFIKDLYHPLPSLKEQSAIARFLDCKTSEIDELIKKKERLIELLQEKRTALITQTVTKGLVPCVHMKDSGVEWLGEIPAHWNIRRLKLIASINDEALSEKTDPQFNMIYVDIGGIDSVQGIQERQDLLFEASPSRARRIVRDGDVIISTVRTYLRAIAPIKAPESNLIVSTGFAVMRPTARLNCDFAAYALRATHFVENIVANSTGVSYPAIEASKVASLPIVFPELVEQVRIAASLDAETNKIDKLIFKIHEAIASLREYRTSLISAAVTGKIDVQEAHVSAYGFY